MSKSSKHLVSYLAGSVALIAFAVYLPSLRNSFVEWDDSTYVIDNPFIRSLDITLFKRAFFEFYASNWHPLTWISHALDYAVWGLNPLGHHLTNSILHAMNVFAVVVLSTRIIRAHKEGKHAGASAFLDEQGILIAGGVTGLLFGLHPVHVESVAWVAERKDLLCALFFLLSIMTYTRYMDVITNEGDHKDSLSYVVNRQYLASLGFFALALLSKPMAVSLPFVLLILDWYPYKRVLSLKTGLAALVHKLPFIVLSLLSSVVTILAQKSSGAIASVAAIPLPTRLLVAAHSIMAYIGKMLLPTNLVPYYPYPEHVTAWSSEYLVPLVLLVGITAVCVMIAKRQKAWLSVWAYYVLTLVPVLGIIQVGGQAMADRYTYLPSLGPFLIMGVVAAGSFRWMNALVRWKRVATGIGLAIAILLFGYLSYGTFKQVRIWRSSIDLWNYVIQKVPEEVPLIYYSRGITFKKMGQKDRAIEDFDAVIAMDPTYYQAYNYRGILYGEEGSFDKAIEHFNKAIAIHPAYANAYANRGFTYAIIGQAHRALDDYNKAIELDEKFAAAYGERGNLYLRRGETGLALFDFQQGCDLGDRRSCASLEALRAIMTPDQKKE
jgi:hypothetical protein